MSEDSRTIILSEDATRITSMLQYNPKTDQCVGLTLPLDELSMPICISYSAATIQQIESYLKQQNGSNSLYVYVAQPVAVDAPFFCVLAFGTDNKFTSSDALKRMAWITHLMEAEDIKVIGYASDGDRKMLRAHTASSGLGSSVPFFYTIDDVTVHFPELHINFDMDKFPFQDMLHIRTKFRNSGTQNSNSENWVGAHNSNSWRMPASLRCLRPPLGADERGYLHAP
ncbi:hypothetical protein QAD02_000659 [Eretmocerus hayati]|uniref:Uncharacterized protein n=1 Tax=Eretmocerus hayati TaxID=131215 RepID=A0ACC2NDY3_9HYME|nr:hypothetical protein QAD02_000659 [Eretmocerus hayati]